MQVLIADDHVMFAESLGSLLRSNDASTSIVITHSLAAVRTVVETVEPDVAVIDWQLPDGRGSDVLELLRSQRPATKAIVLTGVFRPHMVHDALDLGCTAFVTKDRASEELFEAIDKVVRGEPYFSPDALAAMIKPQQEDLHEPLSERELEIIRGVARGLTNPQIADELYLSVHTVRNHLQRISAKLGVGTRLEVALTAIRRGVIEMPGDSASDPSS